MAKLSGVTTPSLTFDEGAAPSTPSSGDVIVYAKTDGLLYSKDDAGTETLVSSGVAGLGAWTNFTPTWTTDGTAPSLGNGTLTGRYKALDTTTYCIIVRFIAGSTTTFGTGTWSFALPSGVTSAQTQLMDGYIEDSGTDNKLCSGVVFASQTKIGQVIPEGGNVVTNTAPQTWANGDKLTLSGILEVTVA